MKRKEGKKERTTNKNKEEIIRKRIKKRMVPKKLLLDIPIESRTTPMESKTELFV